MGNNLHRISISYLQKTIKCLVSVTLSPNFCYTIRMKQGEESEGVSYNPQEVESKWQKVWEQEQTYTVDIEKAKRPFYNLMMFPYPSAEGLHVGSFFTYGGIDVYGRFMRMQGLD